MATYCRRECRDASSRVRPCNTAQRHHLLSVCCACSFLQSGLNPLFRVYRLLHYGSSTLRRLQRNLYCFSRTVVFRWVCSLESANIRFRRLIICGQEVVVPLRTDYHFSRSTAPVTPERTPVQAVLYNPYSCPINRAWKPQPPQGWA